jgi:hypothetical protein
MAGSGDLLQSSGTSFPSAPQAASAASETSAPAGAPAAKQEEEGYTGDGPSFTVYTLGDHDILHSLHDYSTSSEEEGEEDEEVGLDELLGSSQAPGVPRGQPLFPSAGLAEEDFSDDSEMSMDANEAEVRSGTNPATGAAPSTQPSNVPVFPFTGPLPTFQPATSQAPASGTGKPEFLFNGQSAAASMSQFEKENFSNPGNAFEFSIGSSGPAKPTSASSRTPAASSGNRTFDADAEATFNRVSQAFAGLSFGQQAGMSHTASAPVFTAAPTMSAPPTKAPATSAPASAQPAAQVPNLAAGLSGGLEGLGTFNIGKSDTATGAAASSARTRVSARKLSPGKKKTPGKDAAQRAAAAANSGADSSSNNSAGPDAPPKWWTEAQAASQARQRQSTHLHFALPYLSIVTKSSPPHCSAPPDGNAPEPGTFTIPGNLLSDSGSEFSDESSDWEDSFNYEFEGEGEGEDAPEQQEELSTARAPESSVPKSTPGHAPKSPAKEVPPPVSARSIPPLSARGAPPLSARGMPQVSARGAPPVFPQAAPAPDTSYFVPGATLGQKAPSRPGTAGATRPASASANASADPSSALPRPKTQEQKAAQEQQSEASMAHLAELYSKQGKDLYSSGSYAR